MHQVQKFVKGVSLRMAAVTDLDTSMLIAPVMLYLLVLIENYFTDFVAMEYVFQM